MDNSLRLITAWLQCCNILEIPAPGDVYPAALTVVAGDLLFSLMKELTFSYLTSPTSLSGVPRFFFFRLVRHLKILLLILYVSLYLFENVGLILVNYNNVRFDPRL